MYNHQLIIISCLVDHTVYINHRPAFGLEPGKLLWAFDVLGVETDTGDMMIERGDLLDFLQTKGELQYYQ